LMKPMICSSVYLLFLMSVILHNERTFWKLLWYVSGGAGQTFRPFDTRRILYHSSVVFRVRNEVMQHLAAFDTNLHFSVCRQTNENGWAHAFVGRGLTESCFISNRTSEIAHISPLWLMGDSSRSLNLSLKFLASLSASLNKHSDANRFDLPKDVDAEHVLSYLYAVLYAPSYRSRYAEYLKSDFPRIPIQVISGGTRTFAEVWQALVPLGQELIDLHLLRKVPASLRASFPIAGNNAVEKPRYVPPKDHTPGRVWINATQYFEGVTESTWAFKIGGYQVCEKWLKDRKGRELLIDDIEHYSQVVAALTRTQTLMAEIDSVVNGQLWPHHA
jgi:Type ISP C-terminal specificity domain